MRPPDVAVLKSTFTAYQAYRVYRFCDRFAIERSLVLLVNCYDAQLTTKPSRCNKGRRAFAFGQEEGLLRNPSQPRYAPQRLHKMAQ